MRGEWDREISESAYKIGDLRCKLFRFCTIRQHCVSAPHLTKVVYATLLLSDDQRGALHHRRRAWVTWIAIRPPIITPHPRVSTDGHHGRAGDAMQEKKNWRKKKGSSWHIAIGLWNAENNQLPRISYVVSPFLHEAVQFTCWAMRNLSQQKKKKRRKKQKQKKNENTVVWFKKKY